MKGIRFELWEGSDQDGGRESMLMAESDEKSRAMLADAPYLKYAWTVEAENRHEAMQLYYDHMRSAIIARRGVKVPQL